MKKMNFDTIYIGSRQTIIFFHDKKLQNKVGELTHKEFKNLKSCWPKISHIVHNMQFIDKRVIFNHEVETKEVIVSTLKKKNRIIILNNCVLE